MGFSFKYILLLFLLSYIIYILSQHTCGSNDGYKNYLEIDEDLNKKILDEYEKLQKDKELIEKNNKIIPKYLMELHYNKKDRPKELDKDKKRIYKPLKMKMKDTDYSRYETILSKEFQVDQIKYIRDLPEVKDPGIKEMEDQKEDRKKLFDPEKSCKGEWGEWNTDRCGDPSNRCALKFRKYKILKAEKPGGDTCKFKDGEEQFEYCYGKNHNERCGHGRNLCECNLNKYDRDPSNCNIDTDKNCRCPPGHTFNDVDVTNFIKNAGLLGNEGEDGTERDRIGYDPTFSLKKGSCRKNKCFCDNGTEAEGTSCNGDGEHICELTPCNTGYVLKGNPPRCYKESDGVNCPYSNDVGESITIPQALSDLGSNIIYCGKDVQNKCAEGYEKSEDKGKCNSFYENFKFDSIGISDISCCLPKPGQCKFSEISGEGKPYRNIFDSDEDLINLRKKNIDQLRKINTQGEDGYQQPPDTPDGKCLDFFTSNDNKLNEILLNSGDSKESMVQYIYNNACDRPITGCTDNSNNQCRETARKTRRGSCLGQGSINDCKDAFVCNNGYVFEPDNHNSKKLILNKCENNKPPEFNGKCIPQKCNIDPSIRERYSIPRSVRTCDNTLGANCGLHDLKCRRDTYIERNNNDKIITPLLKCENNILIGYGCNSNRIPYDIEANNERFKYLMDELKVIKAQLTIFDEEYQLSKKLKNNYMIIDEYIKQHYCYINPGNLSLIFELDEGRCTGSSIPSPDGINLHLDEVGGRSGKLYKDDGTWDDNLYYADMFKKSLIEYGELLESGSVVNNFRSQYTISETLNEIRLGYIIIDKERIMDDILKEIESIDNEDDDVDKLREGRDEYLLIKGEFDNRPNIGEDAAVDPGSSEADATAGTSAVATEGSVP